MADHQPGSAPPARRLAPFGGEMDDVIVDPAMVDEVDGDWTTAVDAATAPGVGIAIAYRASMPEPDHIRVLLGDAEAPDPEWLEHATNQVTGALLHVPSGRLALEGAEYVWPTPGMPAEEMGAAFRQPDDEREDWHPRGSPSIEIPPGTYLVDAFEVDWPEAMWDAHLRRAVGDGPIRLDQFFAGVGCLGAILTLVNLLAAATAIAIGSWSAMAVLVVIVIGFWFAFVLGGRFSGHWEARRRIEVASDAWLLERPSTVVRLTPCPANHDGPHPAGRFGNDGPIGASFAAPAPLTRAGRLKRIAADFGSAAGCLAIVIGIGFAMATIVYLASLP